MENGVISQFLIPGIAFLAVVAILGILRLASTNYIKVTPNEVAIVSGSRHRTKVVLPGKDGEPQEITRGYKLVTGGAFFKIPIRDRVEVMELNLIQIPVLVNKVPAANGVLVSVKGIANIKILSDQASLALAVERFLGRKLEEIERVARENLESNLRAVVGTMTVEELIKDRNKLQTQITGEASTDMAKMGLGVDIMNIQEISDENGYIEALGKARTAEVKRDATIGEAEAKRDADIRSAAARQAGQTAVAEADQAISDVNKAKDVRIARTIRWSRPRRPGSRSSRRKRRPKNRKPSTSSRSMPSRLVSKPKWLCRIQLSVGTKPS
jgi:flotillin